MRKMNRQVSAEIVYKSELSYRVSIGGAHGIANSPQSAVTAALLNGRFIPDELGLGHDRYAIINFLEEKYEESSFRNILINIIKSNQF